MDYGAVIASVAGAAGAFEAVIKAVKATKELVVKVPAQRELDASPIEEVLADLTEKEEAFRRAHTELLQAAAALHADRAAFQDERAKHQQAVTEHQKAVVELDQERRRFQDFAGNAARLQPVKVSEHSHAYEPKDAVGDAAGAIYFCQRCYDNEKISTLHFHAREFHFDLLRCPECGQTIRLPNDNRPMIETTGRRRRLDDF